MNKKQKLLVTQQFKTNTWNKSKTCRYHPIQTKTFIYLSGGKHDLEDHVEFTQTQLSTSLQNRNQNKKGYTSKGTGTTTQAQTPTSTTNNL